MNAWAEVQIELYPPESGGRQTPLDLCNDHPGRYRPHFRLLSHPSELLGVEFMDGPDDPVMPGKSTFATVRFLYEPAVSYAGLTVGTEFEIVEGPRAIGRGKITRRE
jgi:hypothetical protein